MSSFPVSVPGTITVYQGDPKTIKISFTDDNGNPYDLSTSTWVATGRGGVPFTVDTSDAATGDIYITVSSEQSAVMPPLMTWDLIESGRWDRTVVIGRFERVETYA